MSLQICRVPSPVGPVVFAADGPLLCALAFEDQEAELLAGLRRRFPGRPLLPCSSHPAADRLAAYFAGDVRALDELPVSLGGTPFQRLVWTALRSVPPGTTVSYRDLAQRIGRPRAVRAVGAANGANPVALAVPCHRVIGADGGLCGYAGGLDRKRWLLDHER